MSQTLWNNCPYHPLRSTDDANSTALHIAVTHLDKRTICVRTLFIDYSSAFNTIVPSKLNSKLRTLGLNTYLCNWILDFLMGRPQVVRVGNNISSTLTLHTGPPPLLSLLLYSLFTHDCLAAHDSNTIIKFAEDTVVVGITGDHETAYREEVRDLAVWCQDNKLSFNFRKLKELIMDFRKRRAKHAPIHIDRL